MAERVGFDSLNVVPCSALNGLVGMRQKQHLATFSFPLDIIDGFWRLIHGKDVAQQQEM
jgi:hypothetical protein